MEFVFEQSPWELAVEALHPGDSISGAYALSLLEDMSEEQVQQALLLLEEKHITLDISDLPKFSGGEAAVRLRLEQQLAEKDRLIDGLEENDPLRLYLTELADMPAGDVDKLAEQYASGDEDAARALTDASLGRVVQRACALTGRGVLLLDLIQEGSLGLWQGILCYTGGDFTAHISWWIDQYLAKTVLLQACACQLGQRMRQGMEDYRDMDRQLLAQLGRNPTPEEIAEAIHVTAEEAAVYESMLRQANAKQQVEQARAPKAATSEDNQDVESTAYFQTRQRIAEMLSVLTEQEARLISLRFGLEGGLPLSPQQAGEQLGLTPDEVVQLETAALLKLRQRAD